MTYQQYSNSHHRYQNIHNMSNTQLQSIASQMSAMNSMNSMSNFTRTGMNGVSNSNNNTIDRGSSVGGINAHSHVGHGPVNSQINGNLNHRKQLNSTGQVGLNHSTNHQRQSCQSNIPDPAPRLSSLLGTNTTQANSVSASQITTSHLNTQNTPTNTSGVATSNTNSPSPTNSNNLGKGNKSGASTLSAGYMNNQGIGMKLRK